MNGQNEKPSHGFNVSMRKDMSISGVKEVVSFDDCSVLMKTACGEMTVEGSEIRITVLDTDRGVVTLEGKVDSVWYAEEKNREKRGLFGKVMR